jgi:hypothetical protein
MRSGSFAEGKSACQSCAVCGLAARSHCSRCQLVHYCGRDCQRTAWRTHKSQCKPAPAPAPASAPAPSPAPTPVSAPASAPASAPVEEKHEAAVVDIEDLTDPRALARIRAQSRRCNCRKCASLQLPQVRVVATAASAPLCHGTPGIYDPHHIRRLQAAWVGSQDAFWAQFVEDYYLGEQTCRWAAWRRWRAASPSRLTRTRLQ